MYILANRNRPIRISVRLNEEEHQKLLKQCESTGLPIEGLIRKLIQGVSVKARPPDSYFDLRREVAAIGNNINQIAYVANLSGNVTPEQIQQTKDLLTTIWELLLEKM